MSALERRAAFGLSAIMASRMLGLFLILPIFTLYADALEGSTPQLIGLAIGAYGLSQALLQIPMGVASDRFGRRPVILAGLALFVLGSVIAALSESIYGIIAGRVLQGAGAVSAAVMALAADLTRPEQRAKIMAVLGISVGGSFMMAMVLGPLIAGVAGLPGVFWTMAVLALAAIASLYLLVPLPPAPTDARPTSYRDIPRVLRDGRLMQLNLGILALHVIITAGFVVLPVLLRERLGLAAEEHWRFYVPILLLSVVGMMPLITRRQGAERVLPWAVGALALTEVALALGAPSVALLLLALWLYFTAFNVLEASLPALISRLAPADVKGTALGVYASAQFIGAFVGGAVGGSLYGQLGMAGVFWFCAAVAALWFALSLGLGTPSPADASAG